MDCALTSLSAPLLIVQRIDAQAPASPTASVLKAEIEPFSIFLGQWNCEGEFVASKKPIASHIAVAPDLGGSWLAFRWDDNAPNQYHALELWGFDKNENNSPTSHSSSTANGRLSNLPVTWTSAFDLYAYIKGKF